MTMVGMRMGVFGVAVFLCAGMTFAQDKPEPPRRSGAAQPDTARTAQQPLPQIDLPEFLITGQETIDLPEFSKTSLDEQRLFDASTRRQGPGQRESTRVDFAPSSKERYDFGPFGEGFSGKVVAGYGSYRTPFFDAWFGNNSRSSDFLLKAGYRSSDGFIANTDYRRGHSSLTGGWYVPNESDILGGARIQAGVGFNTDSYKLYGSTAPTRQRSVNRFTGDVSINSSAADLFTYTAATRLRTASLDDSIKTSETAFGFEFTANNSFNGFDLRGDASAWLNSYSSPTSTHNPHFAHLGITARYLIAQQLDIGAGANLYALRGSHSAGRGQVYPYFGVSWYASRGFTLFARFDPSARRNSLSSIVQASPFVRNDVEVRHEEHFLNFAVGAETGIAGIIRAKVTGSYSKLRNNPVYVADSSSRLWIATYFGETRILLLSADMYADITPADHAAISLTLRDTKNSLTDKSLPYHASFTASGLYQHRFPFGLVTSASVRIIGNRPADVQNTRTVNAFTLADFRAEYPIIRQLSIGMYVNNILDHRQLWWENFRGEPRTLGFWLGYSW